MKIWEQPKIISLGLKETYGKGNDDYIDPTKPPEDKSWVWCNKHNRWHPKNHSIGES